MNGSFGNKRFDVIKLETLGNVIWEIYLSPEGLTAKYFVPALY